MSRAFWINNMHSSQRDVAALIKRGAGDRVHIISSHRNFREEIFMTADEYFLEAREIDELNPEKYADWMLEKAIEKNVSAILAMRFSDELVLRSEEFKKAGIRVAGGATSNLYIQQCEDKFAFFEAMKADGISVPDTYKATDAIMIRKACHEIETKGKVSCVKPNIGVYGKGFWIFAKEVDPFDIFSGVDTRKIELGSYIIAYQANENRSDVIVMEYLPGVESSVDCVCDAGKIVAHAVRRKIKGMQVITTGGKELELAQVVARKVSLDGLVNIQLKEDAHGIPHVLEVNTRPSGGVGWSIAAGINLPYATYCMMNGDKVPDVALNEPVVIRSVGAVVPLPLTTRDYINGEID